MRLLRQHDISGRISLSSQCVCSENGQQGLNPLIRNPLTGEVYLPGSFIKDKLKDLLKADFNSAHQQTDPLREKKDAELVDSLFGTVPGAGIYESGPARLVVRDALPVADAGRSLDPEYGFADLSGCGKR